MSVFNGEEVKYSVLIAGYKLDLNTIDSLLTDGIKIIWFGNSAEKEILEKNFPLFVEENFLCIYNNISKIELEIIDGKISQSEISKLKDLEKGDEKFNLNQFLIEHDNNNQFIVVKAGAGSGKTFVMEHRLMFLAHTKPDFSFEKVVMVTFTNDATDSMRRKLVELLECKYRLTRNIKYLDWVESIPAVTISTIHSFFKNVILEVGPLMGYGINLKMTSMVNEKRNILKNILNEKYGDNTGKVEDIIGLKTYELEKLATQYWKKIENQGLSEEDVSSMNWGATSSDKAEKIQETLKYFFENVGYIYDEKKREKNSIAMSDIIHEFGRVVSDSRVKEYIKSKYDYMFCDEFQDSDDIQIQTIVVLDSIFNGSLFVVGDIKQSIYRFRGATDSAFERFENNIFENFGQNEYIKEYTLSKNYRTSADILNTIDKIFRNWSKRKYLKYDFTSENNDVLTAQKDFPGIYKQIRVWNNLDRQEKTIAVIEKIQEEIKLKKTNEKDEKENKKQIIMFLTRTNKELQVVKSWLEEAKIACSIKEKGKFYQSDAVRDFYWLVEALLYYGRAEYLFNALNSSYFYHRVDEKRLKQCNGINSKLVFYFYELLSCETSWNDILNDLTQKPIMEVLRTVVDQQRPTARFGALRRQFYLQNEYSPEEALKQSILDSKQYAADLQKLLQILSDEYYDDFSTLPDICKFLEIKINTDKEEDSAELPENDLDGVIMGSTVHGSKGLEFSYVIIPFMNDSFGHDYLSEILIDKQEERVGWKYKSSSGDEDDITNNMYEELKKKEDIEIIADETRLLYVAMTRAIEGLFCFPDKRHNGEAQSWSDLLPEDLDDENYI